MRTIKRIYISGPMTGLPEFNFPAFNAAADALQLRGYSVVNPAELNPDVTTSRYTCLRVDLAALVQCDALALLPGWEHSPGARREVENALSMGFIVAPVDAFTRQARLTPVGAGDGNTFVVS